MALMFSIFLWPPEPLLQYPCVRAQMTWVSHYLMCAFFSPVDWDCLRVSGGGQVIASVESLASRNRCNFENVEPPRFLLCPEKKAAIFPRFCGDFFKGR